MTTYRRDDDAVFSPVLAAIEAREPAVEGWGQRVEPAARAIYEADYENVGRAAPWAEADEGERGIYRRLAAAALSADAPAGQATGGGDGEAADAADAVDAGVVQAILGLPIRLKAHRAARGLSVREVGRETGLSFSTIHRIEHGHDYTVDALIAVAAYLDGSR